MSLIKIKPSYRQDRDPPSTIFLWKGGILSLPALDDGHVDIQGGNQCNSGHFSCALLNNASREVPEDCMVDDGRHVIISITTTAAFGSKHRYQSLHILSI